jgi:hypothetical protein
MEIYDITSIGGSNLEAFSVFMPEHLARRLGKDPGLFAIGAIHEGYASGALVFSTSEDTVWIESLDFVRVGEVERTCAQDLLAALADIAQNDEELRGITAIFSEDRPGDVDALLSAYREGGYLVEKIPSGAYAFSLSDALAAPAFAGKGEEGTGGVKPLSALKKADLNALNRYLAATEGAYIDLPLAPEDYIQEMSVLSEGDGKSPDGVLLFDHPREDEFSLALFLLSGKNAPVRALPMLRKALKAAEKQFPPHTTVNVACVTDASRALLFKLIGQDALKEIAVYEANLPLTSKKAIVEAVDAIEAWFAERNL